MCSSWKGNSKKGWGQEEEVTDEGTPQGSEHEVQSSSRTRQGLFAHLINRTISSLKKATVSEYFQFFV